MQISKHFPNVHQEKITAALGYAEEHVQLGHPDNQGRRIHEAENNRMGDEVDRIAQLDEPKSELDAARHQGEQQGQADIFGRAWGGQWCDCCCGHQ